MPNAISQCGMSLPLCKHFSGLPHSCSQYWKTQTHLVQPTTGPVLLDVQASARWQDTSAQQCAKQHTDDGARLCGWHTLAVGHPSA